MPRVSVNLCCYNSERYLEETLQSIFAQTYRDWELVIINDGSTDGTEAIIRRHLAEGRPIRYHAQEHVGLPTARNEALRRSSGELMAFIDHDDVWLPEKLARQVPLFDSDDRIGLVYSDCLNIREDGLTFRHYEKLQPAVGEAYRVLLSRYFLCVQTVVIHRRVLRDGNEWFDPEFQLLEDAELFLRVAFRWRLAYVPEALAHVRWHAQSATRTQPQRILTEMRALLEKQRTLYPQFDERFRRERGAFAMDLARAEARFAWAQHRVSAALDLLRPFQFRHPSVARDVLMMRWLSYPQYERLRLLLSRL